jgi:hypothetical protein
MVHLWIYILTSLSGALASDYTLLDRVDAGLLVVGLIVIASVAIALAASPGGRWRLWVLPPGALRQAQDATLRLWMLEERAK